MLYCSDTCICFLFGGTDFLSMLFLVVLIFVWWGILLIFYKFDFYLYYLFWVILGCFWFRCGILLIVCSLLFVFLYIFFCIFSWILLYEFFLYISLRNSIDKLKYIAISCLSTFSVHISYMFIVGPVAFFSTVGAPFWIFVWTGTWIWFYRIVTSVSPPLGAIS